ncbi:MAG: helix-turn-helix domain-containing protein [Methylobacterium sp.]|uniref:helix-turn-helix domain-containing protein n=1 Tax=Methylobacterium sp. TaxID=409 RepID=UPI0025D38B57|nr:helix-turn-helix domain-containing protein [Methylobacterium sp.]MBX9932998.1 helix-turn-helix domain-containing protein [Methylobacterium sp.]
MSIKSVTDIDRAVGERIAALRRAKGLSQAMLGIAIGVSFQQVAKYEKGLNRISGSRLQEAAQALDVPVFSFFGEVASEVTVEDDVFESLAEAGAVELLGAYAAIKDAQLRGDVLAMICIAARIGTRPVAGKG